MSQGMKLVVLALLLGALGYLSYRKLAPEPAPTVATGASEATCPNGTMACPNDCLKREAEGWMPMHVAGHPDTDVWMKFVSPSGRTVAYNQNHVGHMIELVDGKYTDTGVCPVCRGTTRVCR